MNIENITKRFVTLDQGKKALDKVFFAELGSEMEEMINKFIDWKAWEECRELVEEFVHEDLNKAYFAEHQKDIPNRDELVIDLMNEIIADWKKEIHEKMDVVIKS